MKVFIDASVIIAGILSPNGGSAILFQYIKQDLVVELTSQTAIDEVLEHTKKIKKNKEEIGEFIAQSAVIVRKRIEKETIRPYSDLVDKEDAYLIAGAILTKCTHLVTLDKKHLLRPDIKQRFLPLRIVSPKEILEEIIRNLS